MGHRYEGGGFTAEELSNLTVPARTSADLDMDPCKAGERDKIKNMFKCFF